MQCHVVDIPMTRRDCVNKCIGGIHYKLRKCSCLVLIPDTGVDMGEVQIAALLCSLLGGAETEERHGFSNLDRTRAVRVDCETPSHVIEIGLDQKSSSRDSVHQAVFAAGLAGKTPMVVLIDRDGVEGRYEQEMRAVTETLKIEYAVCRQAFIVRWVNTAAWRNMRGNDLPRNRVAATHCDLNALEPDPSN